jgi:hypothetical protein
VFYSKELKCKLQLDNQMELGDFHVMEPWTKWEVHNGLDPVLGGKERP